MHPFEVHKGIQIYISIHVYMNNMYPDIFSKFTPSDESQGSLTTSVSHWTKASELGMLYPHNT